MDKKKKIKNYLYIFALAIVIILLIFIFSPNKKEGVLEKENIVAKEEPEKIDLKLYYDFEGEPQLFEFKDYWNNYKLIEDKSVYGNEGHLLPYDKVFYPEIIKENFKGNALKFENKGELDVRIKNLVEPNQDLAIIFYFKPLLNIKYKIGLNEIALIEEDKSKPFPGEIRINIDKDYKISPSNILQNNSYLVKKDDWNSFIINQNNISTNYILNGAIIANYPRIMDLNYMRFKPYYVLIDEIMIYNGSLTDSEINELSIE